MIDPNRVHAGDPLAERLAGITSGGRSRPAKALPVGGDGPERQNEGVGGQPSRFSFELDYPDSRGRRWKGSFKAHVLNVRERRQAALLRTDLLDGRPLASLTADAATYAEVVSWLHLALDERPPWARDLEALLDARVLAAIYDEVASYEASFWGADGGAEGPGDAPGPVGVGAGGVDGADAGRPPG